MAVAAVANAKILFTGRPEVFENDSELRVALGLANDTGVAPTTRPLQMARFKIDQIEATLREAPGSVRSGIVAAAKGSETFYDLVSRPSLLQQLSTIWESTEVLRRGENISSATIMSFFLESVYDRQAQKIAKGPALRFMPLNRAELEVFTYGIAVFMLKSGKRNQISNFEIREAVESLWNSIQETEKFEAQPGFNEPNDAVKQRLKHREDAVEILTSAIRSHEVIVRDYAGSDQFKFAHMSYFEVLVARFAARALLGMETVQEGIIGTALGRSLPVGSLPTSAALKFCAELLRYDQKEKMTDHRFLEVIYSATLMKGGFFFYAPAFNP